MKMSSAENPGKENRGLTLIPCAIWRASSSDVRYRDVLQGVGPRKDTAVGFAPPANFLGRPHLEALSSSREPRGVEERDFFDFVFVLIGIAYASALMASLAS